MVYESSVFNFFSNKPSGEYVKYLHLENVLLIHIKRVGKKTAIENQRLLTSKVLSDYNWLAAPKLVSEPYVLGLVKSKL